MGYQKHKQQKRIEIDQNLKLSAFKDIMQKVKRKPSQRKWRAL